MDLFADYCNICYKANDGSIKDISEENMSHLRDTLITLVGHADIIKDKALYLCQLCCEQITHFDNFRKMCDSHLIHLRQIYLNMKSKLDVEEDAAAAKNTFAKFVHDEVLRRNSLETRIRPVSISTEYLQITKHAAKLNKNDTVFNRQVKKLCSERNECDSECSSVSDIESNTSQIQFMNEKFDLKNEIENRESENFKLKIYESESSEHVKRLEIPVVNNSEASVSTRIESTEEEIHVKQENISGESEVGTIENEFSADMRVAFEFVNVCTSTCKQECGDGDIGSGEDANVGMKVQPRRNNTSTAATNDAQHNRPHDREYRNRSPIALQSGAHNQVFQSVEAHICAVCKKSFRNSRCLTRHTLTHNDNRPYECSVCNKAFKRVSNLTEHERIHSGAKPFKCTVCNKTFTQSIHLITHERIHSGARPYECTVCNKTFKQLAHLTTHERIHSGAKPYLCTVCKKAFTDPSSLFNHKRIHSDARPYHCTFCNKTFAHRGYLNEHERIHSGAKPYKCTICYKTFTQSTNLSKHKRIHSDGRPYRCTVCNKTFKQSAYLIKHERTHSDERPYKCTVCNKTFKFSFVLTKHERIHSDGKP